MGQDIKLIFSDLDGTLLRNDKSLSPYTRAVLARCRERGILFFAATARPPRALENWIHGLRYDGALCHNGGVAMLHGKLIWEQGIPPKAALDTVRRILAEFPAAQLSAEIGGELYANFDCTARWPDETYLPSDFSGLPDKPAEKLIVELEHPGQADRLRNLFPGLSLQVSENKVAMLQPKGVEKGRAARAVCERLGFSPSQAVGFGDDYNDISLLQACGAGVAVENALPEVKAAADEVCRSNEEDGVARWLAERLNRKGA